MYPIICLKSKQNLRLAAEIRILTPFLHLVASHSLMAAVMGGPEKAKAKAAAAEAAEADVGLH